MKDTVPDLLEFTAQAQAAKVVTSGRSRTWAALITAALQPSLAPARMVAATPASAVEIVSTTMLLEAGEGPGPMAPPSLRTNSCSRDACT